MDYGYKVTTNGRNLMAALMALGSGLTLTRVAMGSGTVEDGTDLADVHELISYVTDGTIGGRSHQDDLLNIAIQYANSANPDQPTFYLAEFMVYATDPETGEETDLLYATLGDYKQVVPAYSSGAGSTVFNFPLTLVVSNDIDVTISAPAGLVTYDELEAAVATAAEEIMERMQPGWSVCGALDLTIPVSGWVESNSGSAEYAYVCDVEAEGVTSAMIPSGAVLPGYFAIASKAGMLGGCEARNNCLRFYSATIPDADILARVNLFRMGGSGGGGGSVDPGVGLSYSMDGRLNVNVGDGLSVGADNTLNVDRQEVVTDSDMLDEDETEESLRDILLSEGADEPGE